MRTITNREHEELMRATKRIQAALADEMGHRASNTEHWIEVERMAVVFAANDWAIAHGLPTVTVLEVEDIEQGAVGHVDYATKLPLYVAEHLYRERWA